MEVIPAVAYLAMEQTHSSTARVWYPHHKHAYGKNKKKGLNCEIRKKNDATYTLC